ncbi:DegT/DnrJ/EryC1/StrS family aminotransferase [Flavobacterium degerlachei]|jgi:dTDP-4-amino-4,6-dideoxygalactose transaminase|uniref:dTDP-4-amino-4,6-dideoxygalactose transaminase n=1 Tax=Flavobacterium degerlachei TaxID=229203 RepID=A0A1H2VSV9_9FLAO|nr:DegT/DnrJ/EryC1/StrS family aminotransferase [Flavobacterium degerlachei]SDW71356.1 dTDP-4-amino-4,6-dideoxygalactose transaminase [Flavobacterium degerlachei]
MNKNKIWLSSPHMGGNEQKFIQEAFDTNWIAPVGANIDAFELGLELYLGTGYVTALNSGTAAIHLGLILLGVKAGDEVLCQTLTFSASANPILYQGAIPVFIDSEPDTWNLCPMALEEAIVDRIAKGKLPKAIIAVALYGVPYKIEEIRIIANNYNIPILEDSAEALGSSYKGKRCGTFGDVSTLSFNGSKIITTSGGGAIVTSTKELKDRSIFLATQAKENAPHYKHCEVGYNYRMSNVLAGIGRGQMEVLDKHVDSRRKMHEFYFDLFKGIKGFSVYMVPNADYFANYWLTTILIDPSETKGMTKETVRLKLLEENIDCRPLWKPMHLQPIYSNYPYYGKHVAESLFDSGLCLPSGSNLSDEDRDRIKAVFIDLFETQKKK